MVCSGFPVVETVTIAGVSPQYAPSKYTSPPDGTELIEKNPVPPPGITGNVAGATGCAGNVAGTTCVTGNVPGLTTGTSPVETMADDTATIAAKSAIIMITVECRIDIPSIGIMNTASGDYFKLPLLVVLYWLPVG